MLYDDVFRVTKAFFSVVDCGNCNNHEDKMACDYCSNHCEHNLLWNVDDNHAHLFTKEIIKLVKEHETEV